MTFDHEYFVRVAWAQVWQTTVVALIVGMMAKMVCRDRPRLAYALWMIVIVKSIVPPIWSSPTSLFSWALVERTGAQSAAAVDRLGTPRVPHTIGSHGAHALAAANVPDDTSSRGLTIDRTRLTLMMILIWGTGVSLCAGLVVLKQIIAWRLLRNSRIAVDAKYMTVLERLSQRLGVKQKVGLIVTSRPIGPAVFGVFRPSILLPVPLLPGMPAEQVELILAHELIHVRRGDILAGKVQLLAQLIWWFNPLIWWANCEAGRERERCCDQDVVAGVGCSPGLYARTLIHVLEQKGRLHSLAGIPGVCALEVTSLRLESIMKHSKIDHPRASLISRVVFATGMLLLVPGTGLTFQTPSPNYDDQPAKMLSEITTARPQEAPTRVTPPAKPGDAGDEYGREVQLKLGQATERLKWAEDMHRKGYVSAATLEQEREKLDRTIDAAIAKERKSELSCAVDRLEWVQAMFQKGQLSKATVAAEQRAVQLALSRLEQSTDGQLKADLQHAIDRLDWAERMFRKGYVSQATVVNERLNVQKLEGQLDLAMAAGPGPKLDSVILKGTVREKKTGRPITGVQISESAKGSSTVTDATGHYKLTNVPAASEYKLVAIAKAGDPFLTTSQNIKAATNEKSITADLDVVRGIPFRVRVLDKDTGKPLEGSLSYFPINPNNPFARGVKGYAAGGGLTCGAFYEALANKKGQFEGAVLPGPGILCFSHPYKPGDEMRADRKPEIAFPDGRENTKLHPVNRGGPLGFVPISSEPIQWTGLPLGQYDAVIAIDPRESAEVVTYEIQISARNSSK